ncbi:MAG: hypothetical protein AAFY57_02840 [Cyanobacteria bacterium J06642_2]
MLTRLWRSLRAVFLCFVLVCIASCSSSNDPVVTVPPTLPPSQPIPVGPGSVAVPLTVRAFNLGGSQLKLLSVFASIASGNETNLLLDTGSSGLRVLASEVGTAGLVRTGRNETVRFGDGTELVGELATAPTSFSTIATEEPVLVHLVDLVQCAAGIPDCPGSNLFGANGPFQGIAGASINFRTSVDDLFSPFTRLAGNLDSGYVIETGGFNAQEGRLTLGLTDQTTTGFTRVPLAQRGTFADGTPFWDDDAFEPAYTISGTAIDGDISNTLLDCGSSDVFLASGSLDPTFSAAGDPVETGRTFRSLLPNVFDLLFTTGTTSGLDRVFVDPVNGEQILGMPFFFRFDTLFDVDGGQIGVRAR